MANASDLLRMAGNDFRSTAMTLDQAQWSLPTPCSDWTVRELIGHVVGGCHMAAAIATGASRDEAIGLLATDFVGDDPLEAIATALDAQLTALTQPGIDDLMCHHPAGDMPGAQLVGFRIADLLVHRWDLARAIGAEEQLNETVAMRVWGDIAPMEPVIAQLGVFGEGPSGEVDSSASVQERLLDLMGRRP